MTRGSGSFSGAGTARGERRTTVPRRGFGPRRRWIHRVRDGAARRRRRGQRARWLPRRGRRRRGCGLAAGCLVRDRWRRITRRTRTTPGRREPGTAGVGGDCTGGATVAAVLRFAAIRAPAARHRACHTRRSRRRPASRARPPRAAARRCDAPQRAWNRPTAGTRARSRRRTPAGLRPRISVSFSVCGRLHDEAVERVERLDLDVEFLDQRHRHRAQIRKVAAGDDRADRGAVVCALGHRALDLRREERHERVALEQPRLAAVDPTSNPKRTNARRAACPGGRRRSPRRGD